MSLCNYCNGIPFENPPPLPQCYIDCMPGLPDEGDLYFIEYRGTPNGYPPSFGYSHCGSEAELQQLSKSCPLCRVIFREFQRIVKHASPSMKDYWKGYSFYITQRQNDQQGFVVWTCGKDGDILRVGSYGYYIKDGIFIPLSYSIRII